MRRTGTFLALGLLILVATPARAATPDYQPDLVSGTTGDGIYGRDPAQVGELGVSPGFGVAFEFSVQNDGAQTDTMGLRLRSHGDPNFFVRITVGTEDVTSQFSPGPYRVRRLASGGAFTFGFGVGATPESVPGDTLTLRLVAISAGDPTARDVWIITATVLDPG